MLAYDNLHISGTQDQRLLMVSMKRLAATEALVVFDHKGVVMFANTPFASMLGYDVSSLMGRDISGFMEEPFSRLHKSWLKART